MQETTIANTIRPLLVKYRVLTHQTMVDWQKSPTDPRITTVVYACRFIDADTGELGPESNVIVDDMDGGDKGPNKASTTANKFWLLRSFQIGAGTKEDSEADETTDKMAAAGAAAKGPRVVKASHGKVERGGKSDGATTAQLEELKRLARELGVTTGDEMQTLIRKVLAGAGVDVSWSTTAEFADYLKAMPSVSMGGLIVALNALVEAQEATEEATGDDLSLD